MSKLNDVIRDYYGGREDFVQRIRIVAAMRDGPKQGAAESMAEYLIRLHIYYNVKIVPSGETDDA